MTWRGHLLSSKTVLEIEKQTRTHTPKSSTHLTFIYLFVSMFIYLFIKFPKLSFTPSFSTCSPRHLSIKAEARGGGGGGGSFVVIASQFLSASPSSFLPFPFYLTPVCSPQGASFRTNWLQHGLSSERSSSGVLPPLFY